MAWQYAVVALLVLLSAAFLCRYWWSGRRNRNACGGCSRCGGQKRCG